MNKLTIGSLYNVIYQYEGWKGNFSGELVDKDDCFYYFNDTYGITKIAKYTIILAMAILNREVK
jgi:hypothetical protein